MIFWAQAFERSCLLVGILSALNLLKRLLRVEGWNKRGQNSTWIYWSLGNVSREHFEVAASGNPVREGPVFCVGDCLYRVRADEWDTAFGEYSVDEGPMPSLLVFGGVIVCSFSSWCSFYKLQRTVCSNGNKEVQAAALIDSCACVQGSLKFFLILRGQDQRKTDVLYTRKIKYREEPVMLQPQCWG